MCVFFGVLYTVANIQMFFYYIDILPHILMEEVFFFMQHKRGHFTREYLVLFFLFSVALVTVI